jgi:hypothetical protein
MAMRLQARRGQGRREKARRVGSGCKRRHSLDQSDGGPLGITPLSSPSTQDPFPPTLSHSGQAEPRDTVKSQKPKPELVWPLPSPSGQAGVWLRFSGWFRTLGIYGVNSTQTFKSDRPPRARLHDRGRGQVCFRSSPIASSSHWSRQLLERRAPARNSHCLSQVIGWKLACWIASS